MKGGITTSQEIQQAAADRSTSFDDDYHPIRRYVLSLVHDPADADDLTQETFLRAYRHKDSLREGEARQAWLYRIATNVCVDRLRQRTRRMRVESGDGPDEGLADLNAPSVEEAAERNEMSKCVQQYVQNLPDSYKSALLLHYEQGLTATGVAEVLGISEGASKIRLHRAKRLLQAAMKTGCALSHDSRNELVCEPRKL